MRTEFILCDKCGVPVEGYFKKVHIKYDHQDKTTDLVLCGSCADEWYEILDKFQTAIAHASKLSRSDLANYVADQFHPEESKNESP